MVTYQRPEVCSLLDNSEKRLNNLSSLPNDLIYRYPENPFFVQRIIARLEVRL
jgi:hypothetical protein